MDTRTLIAMVVTAVVTAMARRLVEAIEGWLKRKNIAGIVMTKAKNSFTLINVAPWLDCLALLAVLIAAEGRFTHGVPLDGKDVGDILGFSGTLAGIVVCFFRDIDALQRHRTNGKPRNE